MKTAESSPVRIHRDTYKKITKLAELIARGGWQSVKSNRSDLPTISAVVDEAVTRLLQER